MHSVRFYKIRAVETIRDELVRYAALGSLLVFDDDREAKGSVRFIECEKFDRPLGTIDDREKVVFEIDRAR